AAADETSTVSAATNRTRTWRQDTVRTPGLSLRWLNGVKYGLARDIERAVGKNRGEANCVETRLNLGQQLLFFAVDKDPDVAVLGADVELAVHPQGAATRRGREVVAPVEPAGFGVEAMHEPGEIDRVHQAVVGETISHRAAKKPIPV